MSNERYRNFATVLYQESAPEDFREIITSWHVPCLLSPYHEFDVNERTGEVKKPHWHLLIMFEGKKSEEQVRELLRQVNGVGLEVINSMRGYARYLCHLDNPEKHQYSRDDVKAFGGADYDEITQLETDKVKLCSEMETFIDENDILSYSEFANYCMLHHYSWYRALKVNCSLPIMFYIKSKQWEIDKGYKRKTKYIDRTKTD